MQYVNSNPSMQIRINADNIFSGLVRNFIAPLWARYERSSYLSQLKYLITSPYRSYEDIKTEQINRLQALIAHAVGTTNYYANRFAEFGVRANNICSIEDLQKLPVLRKEDIRYNYHAMVSRAVHKEDLHDKFTSGSTGHPITVVVDESCMQFKRACTIRHNMWSGWRLGETQGIFWGNQNPSVKNFRSVIRNAFLERVIYINTLKMNEKSMLDFHKRMQIARPTMLMGHAHSLYLFASFCEAVGLSIPPLKGVVSTAMVLHDFERRKIEKTMNTKVYNRYGCEEVSLVASECGCCDGMHINEDAVIVECVDGEGNKVPDGSPGAVLVTDLRNMAMPIIRYNIGDVGTLSRSSPECGMHYKLLKKLQGRIADYLVTPSGDFVSGISLTDNFTMSLHEVKQVQLVQNARNHILFRIVLDSEWTSSSEKRLSGLVRQFFGEGMLHDVEFVDSIQSEKSGKYRFCVSKLNDTPY